jgi:hypothetical protein
MANKSSNSSFSLLLSPSEAELAQARSYLARRTAATDRAVVTRFFRQEVDSQWSRLSKQNSRILSAKQRREEEDSRAEQTRD